MPRIVRQPQGKDWRHRSRTPLFVRRHVHRAWQAAVRLFHVTRMRCVAQFQVPVPRRWRRERLGRALWRYLAYAGALVFLCWFAIGIDALVDYPHSLLNQMCEHKGMSCGIVSGSLGPFLSLGLATSVFLLLPYPQVTRRVSRTARKDPRSLVPTAGTVLQRVVGRKELCQVLTRTLHDRAIRRPCLLVGSVGTGKTAVLVQLTQMLARKHAVPVPIRLRCVTEDDAELDFAKAGHRRFCEMVDSDLSSGGHGDRVWRQLVAEGRVVVIADGLEEMFAEGSQQKERDIAIRRAIRKAEEEQLPLVIASRPHPPLEESDAAIIDLEPLSEEAALEYLSEGHENSDELRLDWIVETAGVAEAPLYLQITRELRQHHWLEYLTKCKDWEDLDTRHADRSTLRLRLLDTWRRALVKGHLHENYALPAKDRAETIEVVSALACVGLLEDSLEVRFDQLIGPADRPALSHGVKGAVERRLRSWQQHRHAGGARAQIWNQLQQRVTIVANHSPPRLPDKGEAARCHSRLSLYAAQGERLGLVETVGDKVRFPHSILQAYLGSRFLRDVGDDHLKAALQEPGPGKELLVALVLNSRMAESDRREAPAKLLLGAAEDRCDVKAFDLYAAALQIDQMDPESGDLHTAIADSVLDRWNEITLGDQRSISTAKEALVHQFGETLKTISGSRDKGGSASGKSPALQQFLKIAFKEPQYPVRLAIAQELGACGDAAFEMLRELFPLPADGPPPSTYDPWRQYTERYEAKKDEERETFERFNRENPTMSYRESEKYHELEHRHREEKNVIRREYVTRAWLVPMMVGSVTDKHRRQARERVELWLQHLDCERLGSNRAELPLILEIALAQGFKSAANRRRRHRGTTQETREFLVQQAETLLARSRSWYSQLTLIHALCLWELPDDAGRLPAESGSTPPYDASQAVSRWLSMAGSRRDPRSRKPGDVTPGGKERLHPFVAEAAELCALALETGHPERYMWVDEKGAMDSVGSTPVNPADHRKHNLWIPPSVGWSTLHPRAQQLLADVLLLLNLAEREGDPDEIDARLERANRTDLPPCFTKDRSPLRPERTVGMAGTAPAGSTCLRDCPFELCPYPAKGQQPRAELQEPFCRQQQALLRPYRRGWGRLLSVGWWIQAPIRHRTAPWQDMTRNELIAFWGKMALRSRTRIR
ncbi:NACHT domain-containing protein [Streptomyces cinnamoneus]|uniref:NACHT domain-containing protein n=1 Tax=Streptomyces cinnamoneus TaxID=53446 RepID=UPI00379D02D8